MSFDMDSFSLKGRVALVVGGSGGIGREVVHGFREAGATVLIVGRNPERLAKVADELDQPDVNPATYSADVRSVKALKELAARVEADHGAIDVLVNCQGTTVIKPAVEVSEDEYDTVLDTNLKSVFFSCVAFSRQLSAGNGGAIINISSLAAHNGWANAAAYCASKWGVEGITRTLAAEWGGRNIRVNAIAPGFFLTDLNRERMSEERKEEARRRNAMKRMGELPELVGAAVFLASDAARFVSGATVRVDGGYLSSGI